MNWFDFVIIGIVVVGALIGLKTGLLGAAVTTLGAIVGWLLAGQFSDDIGGLFDDSLSGDTWLTVISYVIIVAVAIAVAGLAWRFLRPFVTIATLGLSSMVDKLGGLALGFIVGIAVAGAFIVVMARLSYNFEPPGEGIGGAVAGRIPVDDTRESVEGALTASAIVSGFITVTGAIPGGALGFVPSDFAAALDILEGNRE